jgi:hypothetical protein
MFDGNVLLRFGELQIIAGGGYRVADDRTPCGSLGILGESFDGLGGWYFRAQAGRQFVQAHLGGVFRILGELTIVAYGPPA